MIIVYTLFLLVVSVELKYLQDTLSESSKIENFQVNVFSKPEVKLRNNFLSGSQESSDRHNMAPIKELPLWESLKKILKIKSDPKAGIPTKDNMVQSPSIDSSIASAAQTEASHEMSKRELGDKTGSNMNSIESRNFLDVLNPIDKIKTMTLNFPLNEFSSNNPRPNMEPLDNVEEAGSYYDTLSAEEESISRRRMKHHRDEFWEDYYYITHIGGGSQLKCPGYCEVRDLSRQCFVDLKCLLERPKKW